MDDPKLAIVFHLSPRLSPVSPVAGVAMPPPLPPPPAPAPTPENAAAAGDTASTVSVAPQVPPSPLEVQRMLAQSALDHARERSGGVVGEGFLLKNLEKDCESRDIYSEK